MTAKSPKICAILATWNSRKWIWQAIESLQNSTIPVNIIVVDNASSDDTVTIIRGLPGDIELFQMPENLGFAGANNYGLRHALDLGAEYVLLLNQDAKIAQRMIAEIMHLFEQHPDYGIISPLHLNYEGTCIDPVFLSFSLENTSIASDALTQRINELYEVPFINAAVWLISRALVEKIGGFDPIFFMYGEDQDYCHRARFHGFKTGVAPKAIAYHWHDGGKHLQKKSFREQCLRQCAQILYRLKRPDHIFILSLFGILGTWVQRALIVLAYGDFRQFAAMIVAVVKVVPKIPSVKRHHAECRRSGRLWL